jgi:hypothetical protein
MRKIYALVVLAGLFPLLPHASGQSVIAARSGVVNFFEGVVFLDGQPLERKPGIFVRMQEGATLATEGGRAEVLLTPDTYLRMGADTSIRMVSTDIDDTKVELLSGSAILDSAQAPAGAFVKIIFKGETVRPMKPGNYRLDAEPPQLRVFKGEADVSRNDAGQNITAQNNTGKPGDPVTVTASQLMPLDGSTVVKRFTQGTDGLLDIWSDERGSLIASNMANSQSISDPLLDNGTSVPDDLASFIGYGAPMPSSPGGISTYGGVVYPTYPGYGYPGYGYPGYPGYYGFTPYPSLASLLIPAYRSPTTILMYRPRTGYSSSIFTVRPGYTGYSGGITSPSRTTFAPRPVTVAPHVGTTVHVGGHR